MGGLPVYVPFEERPTGVEPYRFIYKRFAERPSLTERVDPDEAGDPLELLHRQVRKEPTVRVVLLLDQFDEVLAELGSEAQLNRLRPLRASVGMVLAVEFPLYRIAPSTIGSSLVQTLTQGYLPTLTKQEATDLFRQRCNANGGLHGDDLAFLSEQVGRHPRLIHLACNSFVDLRRQAGAVGDRPLTASAPWCEALATHLAEAFARTFHFYWQRLAPRPGALLEHEQGALAALAWGDPLTKEMKQAVPLLERLGLVCRAPQGELALFSPLFQQFVQERIPNASPHQAAVQQAADQALSGLELELYQYLQRYSHEEMIAFATLLREVWKEPLPTTAVRWAAAKRKIQVAVSRLRRKRLDDRSGEDIINVRDQGYRLVGPETSTKGYR